MLGTKVVGKPRFSNSPTSFCQLAATGPSAGPLTTMKNLALGPAAALTVPPAASARPAAPTANRVLRAIFKVRARYCLAPTNGAGGIDAVTDPLIDPSGWITPLKSTCSGLPARL
jgi:hypothetical protein